MHVTGDRTVEHGLASIGYDDEGVETQSWDIVRDGMLVGYQLDRPMAHTYGAELNGGRSNGCAYADSPGHIPIQRMANVSLQPDPRGPRHRRPDRARSSAASTSSVTSRGRSTCSASTSSSPASGSTGSRTASWPGMLRDVAYQGTTTEFWGSMEAVGGPADLRARRRLQLRQGAARSGGGGQPRLPVRAVPGGQRAQHRRGGRLGEPVDTPRAGGRTEQPAASGRPRAGDQHLPRLRRDRAGRDPRQPALGQQHADHQRRRPRRRGHRDRLPRRRHRSVSGTRRLHRAGHGPGRGRRRRRTTREPAEDRNDAGRPATRRPDWDDAPGHTSIDVYDDVRGGARRGVRAGRGRAAGSSTASSTTRSPRRTSAPPPDCGCATCSRPATTAAPARPATCSTSAWVGGATRDFADVDAHAMAASSTTRLGWADRQVDLPAGRYDTVLPPTVRGRRDAGRLLGRRRPRRPRGPVGLLASRRRHPDRRADRPSRARTLLRPGLPGPGAAAPSWSASSSSNTSSVFDNGLPLSRTDWIADGTLTSLIQTRHSADDDRAAGHARASTTWCSTSTARPARSTTWSPDVDRGLLLTCMWYIREVDPQTMLLTGLTRDGVYLVEGGEIIGAVNNFRWNESPVDLLRRYTAASATVPGFSREWGDDYFSRTAMPALRVPGLQHVERVAGAVMARLRRPRLPRRPTAGLSRATVRVLVLDHDGRILLFQDSDPGVGHVWWETPGGGIDPGEAELETVVRELEEETGLQVATDDVIGPLARRHVRHGYSDHRGRAGRRVLRRAGAGVRDRHRRPHRGGAGHHARQPLVDPAELAATDEEVWPATCSTWSPARHPGRVAGRARPRRGVERPGLGVGRVGPTTVEL